MYPGRLDEKGRLKLPSVFQQYVGALAEKRLFVTSLDRRTAQLYPIAIWRKNENFLEEYRENPRHTRIAEFNANDLGQDAEMDSQGRVLFPQELRQALGLENSPVRLFATRTGRIDVLSDARYQEMRRQAAEAPEEAFEALQRAGLL
jgi:MraZ protein